MRILSQIYGWSKQKVGKNNNNLKFPNLSIDMRERERERERESELYNIPWISYPYFYNNIKSPGCQVQRTSFSNLLSNLKNVLRDSLALSFAPK